VNVLRDVSDDEGEELYEMSDRCLAQPNDPSMRKNRYVMTYPGGRE